MQNNTGSKPSEETPPKGGAGSSNSDANERLQQERLIDPGNEHRHDADESDRTMGGVDAGAEDGKA